MDLKDVCSRLILYFLVFWPWIQPLLQAALIAFTKELFRIQDLGIKGAYYCWGRIASRPS